MKFIFGIFSIGLIIIIFLLINNFHIPRNSQSQEFNTIELKLSDADIESLYKTQQEAINNTHISSDVNRWRKAKLLIDKKKYKVKVRFHGTDFEHSTSPPYSFAIKLREGEYYKGMNRFSLIMPKQEFVADQVYFHFLDDFFNLKVHTGLYKFIVNGQPNGVIFLEEKLEKTLLERNQLPNSDVLRTLDNFRYSKYLDSHVEPFSYTRSNIRTKSISDLPLGQTESYYKLFELSDEREIFNLIDKNYWAKMDAYRLLFGRAHSIQGHNFQLIYNTANGKFYPYLRLEGNIHKLSGGTHYDLTVDGYIYRKNIHRDNASYNPLFWNLALNDEYILLRNKYLKIMLERYIDVFNYYDSIEASFFDIATINSSLQFQIGNNDQDANMSIDIAALREESAEFKSNLKSNFSTLKYYVENYPY